MWCWELLNNNLKLVVLANINTYYMNDTNTIEDHMPATQKLSNYL